MEVMWLVNQPVAWTAMACARMVYEADGVTLRLSRRADPTTLFRAPPGLATPHALDGLALVLDRKLTDVTGVTGIAGEPRIGFVAQVSAIDVSAPRGKLFLSRGWTSSGSPRARGGCLGGPRSGPSGSPRYRHRCHAAESFRRGRSGCAGAGAGRSRFGA